MQRTTRHWVGGSLVSTLGTVVLLGCGSAPIGPDPGALTGGITGAEAAPALQASSIARCDSLRAPEGNRLATTLYARGDQIYRWDGISWVFVAPSARLFATRQAARPIGSHYAGPTWQSVSGSRVVGSVMRRCPVEAGAVPWLLLSAASSDGQGIFRGVTFIQRVKTAGGIAPAQPGTFTGETANVPYTAEYLFYRSR